MRSSSSSNGPLLGSGRPGAVACGWRIPVVSSGKFLKRKPGYGSLEKFRGVAARDGVSECFVKVDARFRGLLFPNSNIDTERQGITIAELKGHQMSNVYILEGSMCSRNVVCNGASRN